MITREFQLPSVVTNNGLACTKYYPNLADNIGDSNSTKLNLSLNNNNNSFKRES